MKQVATENKLSRINSRVFIIFLGALRSEAILSNIVFRDTTLWRNRLRNVKFKFCLTSDFPRFWRQLDGENVQESPKTQG